MRSSFAVGLLSAASFGGFVQASNAQEQEADRQLDTIVVTTQLRESSIQDAPVSVDVVTADDLERVGATSLLDLSRAVPGLVLQKAPNSSQSGITLRGLGSSPGVASFESSVGLFVNGAYVPRAREFATSMFDVQAVEVVRGTQASLLGKNTSLGAVNVVTRKPGDEFTFNTSIAREFELESYIANAGVTFPVTPELSVRVAGQYEDLGGWVKNTITGGEAEEIDRKAGRISLVWRPSEDFDATLIYETQDSTSQGMPTEFISATQAGFGLSALAGFPVLETNFDRVNQSNDSLVADSFREDSSVDRASLALDWGLGDFTIKSQTSWSQSESVALQGTDFLPGDYLHQATDLESEAVSQEIRLISPSSDRFRYVVGAFASSNDYRHRNFLSANYPGARPLLGAGTTNFDQATKAWSVFGQTDFDLTDRLILSGGLRYTSEDKDVDLSRVTDAPGLYSRALPPLYAPFSLSRSEQATDGLVNLSYQATNNLKAYVSWAQGTKGGGFANSAGPLDQSEYDAEVAQTTEFGVRYQSTDRQWTANTTLFSTQVEDYQLVTFTGLQFIIDNTDLEAIGVETELMWRPVAVDGLNLSWKNTYSDAKDAVSGDDVPLAPLWSGSFVAAYERSFMDGWDITMDGSIDYESSQTHQQDPNSVPRADKITTLNAGIGLISDRGLSVRIVGRNLTDENRYTFVFQAPFLPSGNVLASSERPRTVQLQVGYKY
jgi:iron complex outermembrane recepter protein